MHETSAAQENAEPSRLRLFLALSRTPHGVVDLAAPALGALLGLGAFPPARVMLLGLLTAFAGYTAVYALNDLVDWKTDREWLQTTPSLHPGDLDSVFVRHPLARGYLSLGEGLFWVCAWALVALLGAWHLHPVCAAIFVAACILEAVYCRFLRVHPLRTLASGLVKSSGPVAAVFAVDPAPAPLFLTALFAWVFLWEIGGQNVPNDWSDIDDDRRLGARTVPILLGERGASLVIAATLVASQAALAMALHESPGEFGLPVQLAALAAGVLLFLPPLRELLQTLDRRAAMVLFNRSCWYPAAVLLIVTAGLAL